MSSFAKVAPIAPQAAEMFYGRLFELDPSLRSLFKGDMQEQGVKLMKTLAFCVGSLDKLEILVPAAQNLGKRHVEYGVKDEHYTTVATAPVGFPVRHINMIIRASVLEAIVRGQVSPAFRRWVRPSIRTGGTLRTAKGVIRFGAVTRLSGRDISDADARAAGHPSAEALLADLDKRSEGDIYRIELAYGGDDPRIALRNDDALSDEAWAILAQRLRRLDAASPSGPWTATVLGLISRHPAVRAADLARRLGQERDAFKLDVRKLKELGLTESLDVGYRLSPRGQRVLLLLSG